VFVTVDALYTAAADRYGFGRYSVVLHAPAELASAVQRFRIAVGLGQVTTEPHVSLLAGLQGPKDLDALVARLGILAAGETPMAVGFAEPRLTTGCDWAALAVRPTPRLLALRAAVAPAVADLVASGLEADADWRPHLTLYQGGDDRANAAAEDLAPGFPFGPGFDAHSLDLVGRLGTPPGGTRTIIASLHFGG
jgi:hypothetical protein